MFYTVYTIAHVLQRLHLQTFFQSSITGIGKCYVRLNDGHDLNHSPRFRCVVLPPRIGTGHTSGQDLCILKF